MLHMRFEVLTLVSALWDVMQCNLLDGYRHFKGICCQLCRWRQKGFYETLVPIHETTWLHISEDCKFNRKLCSPL